MLTGLWTGAQVYAGHSLESWLGLMAILVFPALTLGSKTREQRLRIRGRRLESAVAQRAIDLQKERDRERERTEILELVLGNQSLGIVLDQVARFACAEVKNASCAIVTNHGTRTTVAAASGVPQDWIEALAKPRAIPFEVRKQSCIFEDPQHDSAWKSFIAELKSPAPGRICSRAIGSANEFLGALLLFTEEDVEFPREMADDAARLARIAIEHGTFYANLQFQAYHDAVTKLPNRLLFEERLAGALRDAMVLGKRAALLHLDLDRFKQVNETLTHRIGDECLREVAGRIRSALRPGDMVARVGGDEFSVFVGSIKEDGEAEAVAERIRNAVRAPIDAQGRSVPLTVSIGIALFPEDACSAEDLLRCADAAVCYAKGTGRDCVQVFNGRNASLDRTRMEHELKIALAERCFVVAYQPKVDPQGRVAGLEALLRLTHPVHGPLSPAQFIPVAEETGLIVPIGLWLLDEVCRQIAQWREEGFGEIHVAVNVSPVQIAKPDFAEQVETRLAKHGVPPSALELELTESMLIRSGDESQAQMQRLRSAGVIFSIDDFGTGYSSLSYLHRLKVDAIKLDRSFVQSIDADEAARRLVQAMIGVADGLGLGVIAEGVETEAQRAELVAAGCRIMQGYLFCRPLPPAALREYLVSAGFTAGDSRPKRATSEDIIGQPSISFGEKTDLQPV